MPKRLKAHEIEDILSRMKGCLEQGMTRKDAYRVIGEVYERSPETIKSVVDRFRPTVDGAHAYLRAQSLRLAMRVVRKANVSESVDILSRSNIGVLAPKQENVGGGGGRGFFLSVSADSCGAVHLALSSGEGENRPSGSLRSPSGERGEQGEQEEREEASPDVIDVSPVSPYTQPNVPHPTQGTFQKGLSARQQEAIAINRRRLQQARSERAKLARKRADNIEETT